MSLSANDPSRKSWIETSVNSDFPIQNIPFGVFLTRDDIFTIGSRIGDYAIDLGALHQLGYFDGIDLTDDIFMQDSLNDFIADGRKTWRLVRNRISDIFLDSNDKLRNNEELTKEENAVYLTYFSVMLRARENQFYQFKIGMLDEDEWNAMLISFKTLFKEPKHLEIWDFIKITFAEDFVELVDDQIKQSKLYG